jgi:type II secretory ATPase GspE/PulE/Tfp pilus assembly ATPase PilB-like protein
MSPRDNVTNTHPQPTTDQPLEQLAATPASTAQDRSKEEQLAGSSAVKTGIPYLDTRELKEVSDISDQLTLETLRDYRVAPLHDYNPHSIELGLTDQTDRTRLPELQAKLPDVQLTFKTISHTGYNFILNRIYYLMFSKERDGDFSEFGTKLAKAPPKQAFQFIAQLAFWLGASDIHIEPQADLARIRFRLDGTLHPITTVVTSSYKIFLSDLQTRAEIKWGSDEPQSGRISLNLMTNQATIEPVNMRIETIPTFHGEEIVVRIFNAATQNLTLETMGFSPPQIERLGAVTAHPNGMVMTVGPTGSGKTSTLYAIINRLSSPENKVITLEDPVEYDLPGISQIPVHTEQTELFAEKLRAVMREDPNIIMIGEIRDIDTAKTALQAALTGHLVLSTFHATNAATAITRMLDMVSQNPLFASAIRMIVAQRLARRICPHCVVMATPTKPQAAYIKQAIADLPEDRQPKLAKDYKIKHGSGCAACHGLGYKGRIAIIEMMLITPDLEKLMTAITKVTAQELQDAAVKNGMVTLLEDGLAKALEGLTTIDEIMTLTEA